MVTLSERDTKLEKIEKFLQHLFIYSFEVIRI